jgi:hypothetical protein
MLRGFKGFHGELTRYWDQVEAETRERRVQSIAKDTLRNEKNDHQRKIRKDRATKQRGVESADYTSSSNHLSNLQIEQEGKEISKRRRGC